MRHQHHSRALFARERFEQRNDLRLDGDIERRGRFIRHNQARFGTKRQRNHHALTHPAREFMRVGINPLRRCRNAHQIKPANGALAGLGGRDRQMGCHGLRQLPPHSVERVKGGQRVLENRADILAANAAHILITQIVYPLAIQANLARRNPSRRFQQANDGRPGHGFARTRFTDHAKHLTGGNREGHIIKCHQRPAPRWEFHAQMAHFKQGVLSGH